MSYGVEHIDNLLKSSNGMILYQENVMAILNYAGYDMSDCYTILKAIAKASGGAVEAEQTLCKYDALSKKVITGFVPQQEDMASDVWKKINPEIFESKNKKTDFVSDLFEGAEVFKKP